MIHDLYISLLDPVRKVALGVSNLAKSVTYWHKLLGMTLFEQTDSKAVLGYDADKCKLELINLGQPVDHATAFGRIAFSCPRDQLPGIESAVKEAGHAILTPLVSLDTPGKATVEVVILGDPVSMPFLSGWLSIDLSLNLPKCSPPTMDLNASIAVANLLHFDSLDPSSMAGQLSLVRSAMVYL